MPANNAARLLNKLEQARSQIGTMKERELVRLLRPRYVRQRRKVTDSLS